MASLDALLPCFLCKKDCSKDFVAIEKSDIKGYENRFLDVCRECFDFCADDTIKKEIYVKSSGRCPYCKDHVLNSLGSAIHSEINADGLYCSILYTAWHNVYLHISCYKENINL
jgi:hypothetical protein